MYVRTYRATITILDAKANESEDVARVLRTCDDSAKIFLSSGYILEP